MEKQSKGKKKMKAGESSMAATGISFKNPVTANEGESRQTTGNKVVV